MSGPEWTPEHSDAPDEGRPLNLSGNPIADGSTQYSTTPLLGVNPFGAKRPPGDPNQAIRDDAEAEANRLDDEAKLGKLAALVRAIQSSVVGLVHRRAKADRAEVADDPHPSEPPGDHDHEADDESPSKPSRRWAPATWTWETRVGVAAVMSFLILVGVFVVKKGWVGGGRAVALRIPVAGDTKTDEAKKPKPDDAAKLVKGKGATKPGAEKNDEPPTITPPLPESPPGAAPRVADADGGTGAEGRQAPSSPPNTTGGSVASELLLPGGPTSKPETGELPMVATEGALVQGSTGDTSKPPELPPQPSDAPPLPNDPIAGGLPTPVAANDTKSEAEAKSNAPSDPLAPAPQADLPQVVVAPNPQPEPAPPAKPADDPAPVAVVEAAPSTTGSKRAEAAAPQPARPPSGLEAVPASATGSSAAAMGPGWVEIPSGGKRPGVSLTSEPATADTASGVDSPTTARVADGPPIGDDPAPTDSGGGSVLHTVAAGENFWTISKDYYNSHRYYKALHKANAGQVPDIAKLYVGTVIRIPPPEALDRSMVEPPTLGASNDGPTVSRTSSTTKNADPGAEIAPTRSTRPGLRRARNDPVEEPRRPIYKVKANDTLRSIARDTLNDSKRASEIFNLNRDALGDAKAPLTAGTSLTLPEDAEIGRRMR